MNLSHFLCLHYERVSHLSFLVDTARLLGFLWLHLGVFLVDTDRLLGFLWQHLGVFLVDTARLLGFL